MWKYNNCLIAPDFGVGVTPTPKNKGVNYACVGVANQARPLYHVALNCYKMDGAMGGVLFLLMRIPFSLHFFCSGGGGGGGGGIKSEVEVEVAVAVEVSSLKWRWRVAVEVSNLKWRWRVAV